MPLVKSGIILGLQSIQSDCFPVSLLEHFVERALKMRMLTLLINCSFCSIGVHCLCQLKFLDYNGKQLFVGYLSTASLIFIIWCSKQKALSSCHLIFSLQLS